VGIPVPDSDWAAVLSAIRQAGLPAEEIVDEILPRVKS